MAKLIVDEAMPDSEKPKIYPAPSADPAQASQDYAIFGLRKRVEELEQQVVNLLRLTQPWGRSASSKAAYEGTRIEEPKE